MATETMDPFVYTATGVLGEKRDTMLQNQLLLRNELGKPMRRGYTNVQPDQFRFGRPNADKDGGAADALRGWNASLPISRKKTTQDAPKTERDFMSLNKAAVQAGLTSAPENYMFRATHDVRRKVQSEGGKKKMARLPPSMVFGISTRPSTPVHDLLEHRYQDQWLQERRAMELNKRQKEETKLVPGKVYETRASLLRTHIIPVDAAPLWQMPRFSKNAKPHLQTYRNVKAQEAAFKMHQSDGISRKGVFGHGSYEQAKS